jgi:peptidyl-prolyl cis-trans isomerase C
MTIATTDIDRLSAPSQASWQQSVLNRLHAWQRETLVRFMAIGAAIFLLAHLIHPSTDEASRRIVVDGTTAQRIAQLIHAQSGVTPSGEQLNRLESDFIDDEVRYREALRLGLGQDDEIVRRRLIQKVMFLQHDLAAPATPADQDLRVWYDAHPDAFRRPSTLGFEEIYFSPDAGGWDTARARARQAYAYVASHAEADTHALGDAPVLVTPLSEVSREQATKLLGDTPAIDVLFNGTPGVWSQPVQSGLGWHLLRVTHRTEAQIPPFEQLRPQIEAAWRDAQTQINEQRELEALRAQYQIVRTK